MADIVSLPITFRFFQWPRQLAPNPRLKYHISEVATTIVVTDPALDENDAVITGSFLMGIENETIWIPAGSSSDGMTFINCVRGIHLSGIDHTAGHAALAYDHNEDTPVSCNISAILHSELKAAVQGVVATGGTAMVVGAGADDDITFTAYNADGTKPFFRYDKATNQWLYSNDGVSSTPFGTGAGVTGGDGITVTAGDIDVDLTDTTIFKDARTGNEARAVKTKAVDGLLDSSWYAMAGIVVPYAGASAPSGWLLCDGATGKNSVTDTTLAALYAVIGTTYGGTGAADFALPNLRGNVPVGKNAATFAVLGATGGAETHQLITAEMPAHTHPAGVIASISKNNAAAGGVDAGVGITTGSTGGGGAHNNLQPYIVLNYIIKK
jgi:microcystin-dependent protein